MLDSNRWRDDRNRLEVNIMDALCQSNRDSLPPILWFFTYSLPPNLFLLISQNWSHGIALNYTLMHCLQLHPSTPKCTKETFQSDREYFVHYRQSQNAKKCIFILFLFFRVNAFSRYDALYRHSRPRAMEALDSLPDLMHANQLKAKILFSVIVVSSISLKFKYDFLCKFSSTLFTA